MTRRKGGLTNWVIILLILLDVKSWSQPAMVDQLREVDALLAKGIAMVQSNPDSALIFWKQCKDKSFKIRALYQYALACKSIGSLYAQSGKASEALPLADTAILYFTQLKKNSALSGTYTLQGNILLETEPEKALEKFYASIRISEADKDCKQLAITYNNIAILLNRMKDYDGSLRYGRKNLECARKLNISDEIGYACSPIIDVFSERNQVDSMEKYLKIMQMATQNTSDPYLQVISANELGTLYLGRKLYKKAIASFENAIRINQDLLDLGTHCQALTNLGNALVNDHQYEKARKILSEAEKTSKELGLKQHEKEACNLLAQNFERMGDFENAYLYHVKFKLLADTLLNEESQQTMHRLESQFQSEKNEAAIQLLNKENALQVSLAGERQTQRNLILVSSLFLGGIGLFFGNRYVKKRKEASEKALLEDRLRISRDLHDNIGSTLGSISFYSQMAERIQETKPKDLAELLHRIQESSRESVENMADIVWALMPENETFKSIFVRLQNFAAEVLEVSPLRWKPNFTPLFLTKN
jgi:two-component system sensor histidine kinase UhpB